MLRFPRPIRARDLGLGRRYFGLLRQSPDPGGAPSTVRPEAYTAKVKNLLTGQALTDAEIPGRAGRPNKLAELIDTWLSTPEAEAKLLAFFQQAFQQTQITIRAFPISCRPALASAPRRRTCSSRPRARASPAPRCS